jgi:hypothetical protein
MSPFAHLVTLLMPPVLNNGSFEFARFIRLTDFRIGSRNHTLKEIADIEHAVAGQQNFKIGL